MAAADGVVGAQSKHDHQEKERRGGEGRKTPDTQPLLVALERAVAEEEAAAVGRAQDGTGGVGETGADELVDAPDPDAADAAATPETDDDDDDNDDDNKDDDRVPEALGPMLWAVRMASGTSSASCTTDIL